MHRNKHIIAYCHPNVMRHLRQDGMEEYAIHDVVFNSAGESITWTVEALSPRMPSVQALKAELTRLLHETEQSGHAIKCGDAGDSVTPADIECWLQYINEDPVPWHVYYSDEQLAQIALESRREHAEPRILRHKTSDGSEEYAVHEVYFNVFGEVIDWTEDALSPRLPGVYALREELQKLIEHAKPPKYRVISGDKQQSYRVSEVRAWLDSTEEEVLS